jgi:hypothetical protein
MRRERQCGRDVSNSKEGPASIHVDIYATHVPPNLRVCLCRNRGRAIHLEVVVIRSRCREEVSSYINIQRCLGTDRDRPEPAGLEHSLFRHRVANCNSVLGIQESMISTGTSQFWVCLIAHSPSIHNRYVHGAWESEPFYTFCIDCEQNHQRTLLFILSAKESQV